MQVRAEKKHQRGAVDLIMLLAIIALGFIVMSGIKIAPIYIDHWSLEDIVAGVQEEASESGTVSKRKISGMLIRRLDVNRLNFLDPEDVKIIRDANGFVIDISYERRVNFFSNIDVVVTFEGLQGSVDSDSE